MRNEMVMVVIFAAAGKLREATDFKKPNRRSPCHLDIREGEGFFAFRTASGGTLVPDESDPLIVPTDLSERVAESSQADDRPSELVEGRREIGAHLLDDPLALQRLGSSTAEVGGLPALDWRFSH
ncbi:hypothetical protein ACWGH4_00635 [Streptomyces sp. NPDC054847]